MPQKITYKKGYYCNGSIKDTFALTIQEFADSMGKDVEVFVPKQLTGNESLNLRKKKGTLKLAFGITPTFITGGVNAAQWCVYGDYTHKRAAITVIPVYDNKTYYIVNSGDNSAEEILALVRNDVVYITMPFFSHDGEANGMAEKRIVKKILNKAKDFLKLSEEEQAKKIKALNADKKEERLESLRKLAERGLDGRKEILTTKIESANKLKEEAKRNYAKAIRQLEEAELDMELFGEDKKTIVQGVMEEVMELMNWPLVVDVYAEGQQIIMETKMLFALNENPNKKVLHRIGKFKIKMDFSDSTTYWINMTDRQGGKHAPHAYRSSGRACLGNTEDDFKLYYRTYNLLLCAQEALRFPQHANHQDSAGRDIIEWPVVEGQKIDSSGKLIDCYENRMFFENMRKEHHIAHFYPYPVGPNNAAPEAEETAEGMVEGSE